MKPRQSIKLKDLLVMAVLADVGLFSKRLIGPVVNILTDFLRVPGGIGTSFSLMFLVIGAGLIRSRYTASLMAFIQSIVALSLGMVGAMGLLSPIGYMVPGIVIDVVMILYRRNHLDYQTTAILANGIGALAAALTANLIVFRLSGAVLLLYCLIALISGALFGVLAGMICQRLLPLSHQTACKQDKERMIEYENQ